MFRAPGSSCNQLNEHPVNHKNFDKTDYVLFLVTVADKIPRKFIEQMTGYDGFFAIRIEFESNIYRIFCCFDKSHANKAGVF
jgi:hypothetical protein